jgi:high-affinity iron transporter
MIRQALRAANAGDFTGADRQAIDAYLLGFEPLEPRLGVRDAKATLAVEQGFTRLRGAIARRDATAANVEAGALDARLVQLGGGSGTRPFVASFLIYFREGVEAALLVAALLAGLRRLGRADASRYIHAGWLAALPAGLLTWYVLERVVRLGAEHRELVEAVVGLLAAAVLFSVSFWMISKAESRHWMGYLRRQLETTLTRRSLLLLAGLSFLAVYREAAETVLFTQALLLESEGQAAQVWVGALAGLLTVAAIAVALGRSVMKLPLGPFFGSRARCCASCRCRSPGPACTSSCSAATCGRAPSLSPRSPGSACTRPERPARPGGHRGRDRPVRGRDPAAPFRGRRRARRRSGRPRPAGVTAKHLLTLVGQPGCHLCHDMRRIVDDVAGPLGFTVEERDVRDRDDWARYLLEIPVLLAGERELARHRTTPDELARLLRDL